MTGVTVHWDILIVLLGGIPTGIVIITGTVITIHTAAILSS